MPKIIFPATIDGHDKQEQVWRDKHRFIDILAGRRGGKDWICARVAVKRAYQDLVDGKGYKDWSIESGIPRLLYWCVAPDYSINKVQQKEILKIALPAGLVIKNELKSKPPRLWLKGGILFEFKSAEHPDKLVAEGLNGIYVTETARLKPTVWNDNLRPTLSDNQGWGLFATTPLGYNWYADQIRKVAVEGEYHDNEWKAYYWKTIDNTKKPGLVEEVEKAKATMPAKYFCRNYEASLDAFQGQIYDGFDYNVHVDDIKFERDKYKIVVGGIDWGYTHRGVIVVAGITTDDNVHVLVDMAESRIPVVSRDDSADDWCKRALRLQEEYDVEMFYAGPDQPESIDQMAYEGVRVQKANNSVMEGIQAVSTLMTIDDNGHTRLRIDKNCTNLIQNIRAQRWIQQKDGDESEKPEKINDDSNDALRYAIYSAGHWFDHGFEDRVEHIYL